MIDLLLEYLNEGGGVMYILLFTCFVIMHIGIGKIILYKQYSRPFKKKDSKKNIETIQHPVPKPVTTYDWFYAECSKLGKHLNNQKDEITEDVLREVLLYHIPKLESGLETIAAWISVAPLLGLLGTVIGMIQTFKMITLFGVGDPAVMSEGISVALLTTQAGLLVAFPGLLLLDYLKRKKTSIVDGLLADYEEFLRLHETECT